LKRINEKQFTIDYSSFTYSLLILLIHLANFCLSQIIKSSKIVALPRSQVWVRAPVSINHTQIQFSHSPFTPSVLNYKLLEPSNLVKKEYLNQTNTINLFSLQFFPSLAQSVCIIYWKLCSQTFFLLNYSPPLTHWIIVRLFFHSLLYLN